MLDSNSYSKWQGCDLQVGYRGQSYSHHRGDLQMLNAELTPPCKRLYGPSQVSLPVKGHFQGQFTYQSKQTIQSIYVINTLKRNLFGLSTISALNLAIRVEANMQHTNCAVANKFPSIFQDLGNFGESYTIKLKPGAKPHAVYTPRNVTMPLRSKN